MDTFYTSDLRRLTAEHAPPCVSAYLPTHVSGEAGQQDPVRLKNLLQQAEEQMADGWIRAAEARKLLQRARGMSSDSAFWNNRSHGLAIFIAPDAFHCYRLPQSFEELVLVNQRFHIKPLLPLLTEGDRFFMLALSQNNVRLYSVTRDAIERIEVVGMPTNMKEALNYTDADRGSQVHSAMKGGTGKQAAVFHGQGGQRDAHKDDLVQFFRGVDTALQKVLREEQAPMLLAGVEYLLPIYRKVNSYPHLAKQELAGNFDYLSDHELHEKAWPLVAPFFAQAREEAAARFRQLAGTGKTSDDIRQIVKSAREGRIDALFVDVKTHQWGAVDQATGEIEVHDSREAGDDDLLDLAAAQTLLHRGVVYSVPREQIPQSHFAAALLRY